MDDKNLYLLRMSFKIFISSVQKEFAKERKWLADYGQNALNKGLPSRTNDRVNDRVNDRANEGVNEEVNEDVTKNLSYKERLVYALIKKKSRHNKSCSNLKNKFCSRHHRASSKKVEGKIAHRTSRLRQNRLLEGETLRYASK